MNQFNLMCNMTMFWKSWILTFWPPGSLGGSAGKIFTTMLLHFVIPFNLICIMTIIWKSWIEPWHEISNNMVCVTSKASDQLAHMGSLIRAFASRLSIIWVLNYWLNIIWNFVTKSKRRLHRLVWVYTCQNATLLEITCHGSILTYWLHPQDLLPCCCIRDSL